jgi:hypothetical protein
MTAPTTRWTWLARLLGRDGNPLRRRTDRIAAWLVPGAIAAFLLLGPLAVAGASVWVHAGSAAALRAEQSWHRVRAVLLHATPGPMMENGPNSWVVWAPARWTGSGRVHVGLVPAPAGIKAGSVVPVWLDRAGAVEQPPPTAGQIREHVTLAAAFALTVLGCALTCLALLARWLLDRRRLAGWEAGWLSVGPQWSRRD